jgi:hypothetical protein
MTCALCILAGMAFAAAAAWLFSPPASAAERAYYRGETE